MCMHMVCTHMQIQMQVHGVSLTLILYLEQRELEDALLEAGYPLSTEQANPNPNAIPNPSPNLNPNLNPNPSPNVTRTSTRTSILASTEPSHQPSPSNPSPTCTEQVAALFSEHCSTRVDAIKGDVEVVDLEEFKVTV